MVLPGKSSNIIPRRIVSNPVPGTPGNDSTIPKPPVKRRGCFSDHLRGMNHRDCGPELRFAILLKWSAGSLTRISETIARLTRKDPTKMEAPISTLRQVIPERKKSDGRSNISMQFATRFQDRLEQFLHYLFRCAFEIEFRFLRDFPELVQATRAPRVRARAPELADPARQQLSPDALRDFRDARSRRRDSRTILWDRLPLTTSANAAVSACFRRFGAEIERAVVACLRHASRPNREAKRCATLFDVDSIPCAIKRSASSMAVTLTPNE